MVGNVEPIVRHGITPVFFQSSQARQRLFSIEPKKTEPILFRVDICESLVQEENVRKTIGEKGLIALVGHSVCP